MHKAGVERKRYVFDLAYEYAVILPQHLTSISNSSCIVQIIHKYELVNVCVRLNNKTNVVTLHWIIIIKENVSLYFDDPFKTFC